MKKVLYIIMWAVMMMSLDASAAKVDNYIAVLSDIHVTYPKPTKISSPTERKLVNLAGDIFTETVDSLLVYPPRIVLITGDLTENGDESSHRYVASQLKRLSDAGSRVLVIPGNHDIKGEMTREKFAGIYAPYGYTDSRRDSQSLSYAYKIDNNILVLGIDSNGDTDNAIKWAADEAARFKGKTVIAMMHHHLIPHFVEEGRVLPTSVVSNSQANADLLMKAGVHLIFTGHTHIHDAAMGYNSTRTDSIVEACTASLASYPPVYRRVELNSKGKIAGSSTKQVPDGRGVGYRIQSETKINKSIPSLATNTARRFWDKALSRIQAIPFASHFLADNLSWETVEPLVNTHLAKPLTDLYKITSVGCENQRDNSELREQLHEGIVKVVEGVVKPQFGEAAREMLAPVIAARLMPIVDSILEDTNPPATLPVNDDDFTQRK